MTQTPAQEKAPRALALPFLIAILLPLLFGTIFYPMANMELKNLPFAVVNEDAGMDTPQGAVNVGEKVLGGIARLGQDSPLEVHELADAQALDTALDGKGYFGAIVIPEDFTAQTLAAQAGRGEAPALSILLDNAKSPMVANTLSARMGDMLAERGMNATVEVIHAGDAAASSPMAAMLSQQVGVMPLIIVTLVGSLLLTRALTQSGARGWKLAALTVALGLALATVVAAVLAGLIGVVVAAGIGYWSLFGLLWLAAAALVLFMLGAMRLHIVLGVGLGLATIMLGNAAAAMPREVLPGWWHAVYDWVPQSHLGEGIRQLQFMGASVVEATSGYFAVVGIVGLVLVLAGAFFVRPRRAVAAE